MPQPKVPAVYISARHRLLGFTNAAQKFLVFTIAQQHIDILHVVYLSVLSVGLYCFPFSTVMNNTAMNIYV